MFLKHSNFNIPMDMFNFIVTKLQQQEVIFLINFT